MFAPPPLGGVLHSQPAGVSIDPHSNLGTACFRRGDVQGDEVKTHPENGVR